MEHKLCFFCGLKRAVRITLDKKKVDSGEEDFNGRGDLPWTLQIIWDHDIHESETEYIVDDFCSKDCIVFDSTNDQEEADRILGLLQNGDEVVIEKWNKQVEMFRVLTHGVTRDGRPTSIVCGHQHATMPEAVDCENRFVPSTIGAKLKPGWQTEIYGFSPGGGRCCCHPIPPQEIMKKLN